MQGRRHQHLPRDPETRKLRKQVSACCVAQTCNARKLSRRRRAVLARSLLTIRAEQKCTPVSSCLLDRTSSTTLTRLPVAREGEDDDCRSQPLGRNAEGPTVA